MRKTALLIILTLFTQALIAEEKTNGVDISDGVTYSSELLLQISSLPEAKLGFIQHFTFPFLQGNGPLTEDNNIGLNFAAILTEMDLFLYDMPDRGKWDDDKIRWTFSGILNFSFTEKISLTLFAQLRTRKNYLDAKWENLYYRNRTIDKSDPTHLEFYRVAANLTYKL